MTVNSSDYWADVPSVDDEPADSPAPSSKAWPRTSRRTVFKAVGVLGGAFALNLLGALPPARIGSASAAVGSEWLTGCGGYSYADNLTCTGGTYAQSYCGSDGWFRTDGGLTYQYYPITICGGGSYGAKNAWRWTRSGVPNRCADGHLWLSSVGTSFYICAKPYPS
jgi:hypothetical protein